jgi:hypothetical protein
MFSVTTAACLPAKNPCLISYIFAPNDKFSGQIFYRKTSSPTIQNSKGNPQSTPLQLSKALYTFSQEVGQYYPQKATS